MGDVKIEISAETRAAEALIQGFTKKVSQGMEEAAKKVASFFVVERLIEWGHRIIEGGEAMGVLAEKTSMTTEALSGWSYAAKLANVNQEEFNAGLKEASRFLAEFERHSDDAYRTLFKLNLQNGGFSTLEDFLFQVADSFHNLAPEVNRTDLAMAIFGRGGQAMIPVLNKGSGAIQEVMAKAKSLGLVMGGELVSDAREFRDSMSEAKAALEGMGTRAIQVLLPSLVSIAEAVKDAAESFNHATENIQVFMALIKALASALASLGHALLAIVEILTGVWVSAWNVATKAIETQIKVVKTLWDMAEKLEKAAQKMGGHDMILMFKPESAQTMIDNFKQGWAETVDAVTDAGKTIWGQFTNGANEAWAAIKGNSKTVWDSVKGEWNDLKDQLKFLWSSTPERPKKAEASSPPTGQLAADPLKPEQLKSIEDMKQRWNQAFLSKRDQLEKTYLLELSQLMELSRQQDGNVVEYEKVQKAKTQLTAIYGRQREELARQEADATAAIELAKLQGRVARIESDPDKTKAEKKELLLRLLREEQRLIDEQMASYERLAKDQDQTAETHIEALKQINVLETQRTETLNKQRELERDNFLGRMRGGLTDMMNEFGNLGANLAGGVLDGIKSSVQGIGDAIMGVIDGTKTWGQVFSQIGRQIIANIIQIVIQWIASMTIIAALKKLFGLTDKSEAAASAAAWAPAAVAASIASYGGAAVAGFTGYAVAMSAGTALATGLSAAAFAEGGVVPGGRQFVQVNERGPEVIIKAETVRRFGVPFFTKLNQGVLDLYSAMNAAPSFVEKPITADAGAMQQFAQASGGGRSAGASSVHVAPTPLHLAVLDDHNKFLRWLESNAGKNIVVKHVRDSRNEVGIAS